MSRLMMNKLNWLLLAMLIVMAVIFSASGPAALATIVTDAFFF